MELDIDGTKIVINKRIVNSALDQRELSKVIQKSVASVVLNIVQRARSNKRADGGTIKARYSKSYREAILAGTVRGKDGTRVNLTATGEFLQSMQVKELPGGARIVFTGSHAKTSRKKSTRTKAQRQRISNLRSARRSAAKSAGITAKGGAAKKRRKRTGTAPDPKNTDILRGLQERGYKGWFALSDKDKEHIAADVRKYLVRLVPQMFETKKL